MNTLRNLVTLALIAPLLCACAPSPEKVCEHMLGLMKKELGADLPEAETKKMQEECIEDAERMKKNKKRKGPMEWRKAAGCIMDATSMEEVGKCDAKDSK
ncbi:hypothetical protein ACNOYE_33720 [Nannocystaceae bacterium ST9]